MRVVGLTGGMGSGKSTVAAMFAAHGMPVVDADQVARDVVAPGRPAHERIVERFGPEVLGADGAVDRAALARRAFATDGERRALEAITHPAIAAETGRRMAALAEEGHPLAVYEAPLLLEAGRADSVHEIVVVTAPLALRLARLRARGVSEEQARARIASQLSDEERAAWAHALVSNDSDLSALQAQVDALVRRWRERGWMSDSLPRAAAPTSEER